MLLLLLLASDKRIMEVHREDKTMTTQTTTRTFYHSLGKILDGKAIDIPNGTYAITAKSEDGEVEWLGLSDAGEAADTIAQDWDSRLAELGNGQDPMHVEMYEIFHADVTITNKGRVVAVVFS